MTRWKKFSALTVADKDSAIRDHFIATVFLKNGQRFKDDGAGEISRKLVFLLTRFRTPGWLLFARKPLPPWGGFHWFIEPRTFGEALLHELANNEKLIFGYKRKSRWQPGVVALWEDYVSIFDSLDWFLLYQDFHGKTLDEALLSDPKTKDLKSDTVAERIARYFKQGRHGYLSRLKLKTT